MTAGVATLTPRAIGGLSVLKVRENVPHVKFLVYGASGVGKTRLAGSADDVPDMRKVLFIDMEGGTLSLRKTNPNIDVVRVQTWAQMQDVYDELYAGSHEYRTVVLDSLTEIQTFNMLSVMEKLLEGHPDRDIDIPGQLEWNRHLQQMRKFVRGFRDLPMNVIFTALVDADKDRMTGREQKRPLLNGRFAKECPGFFDIILYMVSENHEGEVKRGVLSVSTQGEYIAKDRSDSLPPAVTNPTMTELYSCITTAVKG